MLMKPPYTPTLLTARINKRIWQQHPLAFAVANFGEGSTLIYQGHHIRLSTVSIDLKQGNQHVKLSHLSNPPCFIAVAQDGPQQPLLVVAYGSASIPLFEHSGDDGLIGQVFAFGESPDGTHQTVAHAICLPKHFQVFATKGFKYSIFLEEHPELCNHLFLCGEMINFLLG